MKNAQQNQQNAAGKTANGLQVLTQSERQAAAGGHRRRHSSHKSTPKWSKPGGGWPC